MFLENFRSDHDLCWRLYIYYSIIGSVYCNNLSRHYVHEIHGIIIDFWKVGINPIKWQRRQHTPNNWLYISHGLSKIHSSYSFSPQRNICFLKKKLPLLKRTYFLLKLYLKYSISFILSIVHYNSCPTKSTYFMGFRKYIQ